MTRLILFLPLLLLCRCTTKHQPLVHSPYFAIQPEEFLSRASLMEMQELESKEGDLNPLQKKRLFDLYQIEKKNVKESSDRSKLLDEKLSKLKEQVEPLIVNLPTDQSTTLDENLQSSQEKFSFSLPELKKGYQKAQQAWNQDENEKALDLVEILINSETYRQKAVLADKNRILNLYFRAAFDARDLEKCQKAYEAIKQESSCSVEAAEIGFLYSLVKFSNGQREEARSLLREQCDPNESIMNRIRKTYWLFRMSDEKSFEQEKYYGELSSFPVPGYYRYLADSYRGQNFYLPERSEAKIGDLSISLKTEELIRAAEDRISSGLRKDAVKLLQSAQKELLAGDPKKNEKALVYVSRLFQAAGNHLQAMKTINFLLLGADSKSELASEFMNLYHRPFQSQVEWLGNLWGVDPDFIYSIMRQESAFNPGAVSVAGARGLMQLMPTLSRFLMEQWKAPVPSSKGYLLRGPENIKLATYHLNQLNHLAPHPALVAAAYNAGIYRVSSWWRRSGQYPLDLFVEFIPINETRNYVKLVLRNFIYYKGLGNQGVVSKDLIPRELPPAPATFRDSRKLSS